MRLTGEGKLFARDAAAVVRHANEPQATFAHLDPDRACAGIQRVLQELAHHRGGALDHFAGRDAVHDLGGERQNKGRWLWLPGDAQLLWLWVAASARGFSENNTVRASIGVIAARIKLAKPSPRSSSPRVAPPIF